LDRPSMGELLAGATMPTKAPTDGGGASPAFLIRQRAYVEESQVPVTP
jgi:hypothetical protein